MPDGRIIKSFATGELAYTWLPKEKRTAHIFKELTGSLISIGALCDAGCVVKFTAEAVKVEKDGQTMITGQRLEKLWMIDIAQHHDDKAAQMIHDTTHAEIVKYVHAAMGSPTPTTFTKAYAKGFFTAPGLTIDMVRKHTFTTIATAKGHLHLNRQGTRSTKQKHEDKETDEFPPKIVGKSKTLSFTMQTIKTDELQHLHADLAGRFPYKSTRGKQYVAVFVNEETNYIHLEFLDSRNASDITKAYQAAIEFFEQRGFSTEFFHMDGETSKTLATYMTKKKIVVQFVPPANHRTLKAERAIQTVKNHIISSLCTTDPKYNMNEWDRFQLQWELTLNLLRGSAINPSISAWHQVNGRFDWNRTPLAPIGTRVIIHERAQDRGSWEVHGKEGFYVGPKLDHYRCFEILVTETGSTRITDTVAWFPQHCTMPGASLLERFTEAMKELTVVIQQITKAPPQIMQNKQPIDIMTNTLIAALQSYGEIFHGTPKSSEQPSTYVVPANQCANKEDNIESEQLSEQRAETRSNTEHEATENNVNPQKQMLVGSSSSPQVRGDEKDAKDSSSNTSMMLPNENPSNSSTQQRVSEHENTDTSAQQRVKRGKTKGKRRQATKQNAQAKTEHRRTSTQRKPIAANQDQLRKSARTRSPIIFADGVVMSRQTSKIKGNRQVVKMAKEIKAFNKTLHKALAAKQTDRVLNFRMAMNSDDKEQWQKANDEEFERFKSTNTLNFIKKAQIPLLPRIDSEKNSKTEYLIRHERSRYNPHQMTGDIHRKQRGV